MHDTRATPQIAVEGLHFAYEQSAVFTDFALESQARLILLEGPSGCGKTTLLKLLAGVFSPGMVATFIRPQPTRLILQEDGLFPWLTVEGNLACVPGWKGVHDCPPALRPMVPMVETLAKQRAFRLSFGQRRIVELFRALCFATPLMCLDEPFNFLDQTKRATVATVIENLAAQGICFVVSSHYREDFHSWHGAVYRFDGSLPVRRIKQVS